MTAKMKKSKDLKRFVWNETEKGRGSKSEDKEEKSKNFDERAAKPKGAKQQQQNCSQNFPPTEPEK